MFVGDFGTAGYVQTGGNATSSALIVGFQASGNGTVTLGGGLLQPNGLVVIGNAGQGAFNQSGGTFNAFIGGATLGFAAGGTGAVNLTGGTFNAATFNVYNARTVLQLGGTLNVLALGVNGLGIGNNSGNASYTLAAGNVAVTGSEYVGYQGNGRFLQTGGAVGAGRGQPRPVHPVRRLGHDPQPLRQRRAHRRRRGRRSRGRHLAPAIRRHRQSRRNAIDRH